MTHSVAIIGGGLSGALAAIHLTAQSQPGRIIHLIEKKQEDIGRGTAYSNDFLLQPLNVPLCKMSLFSDRPLDFYQWLLVRKSEYGNLLHHLSADSFVSRKIYGDYVHDRFSEYCGSDFLGIKVQQHRSEAVSVRFDSFQSVFDIQLEDGEEILAHSVILATGNFATNPSFRVNLPRRLQKNFLNDPWQISRASSIDRFSDVLLIGTCSSMLDWLIQLAEQNHCGRVYAISPHGLLPRLHDSLLHHQNQIPSESQKAEFKNINEIIRFLREENDEEDLPGSSWRLRVDALRPHTPHLWQNLSLKERASFLNHAESYWNVHRHRMPTVTAKLVKKMIQEGQLFILSGRINRIKSDEERIKVFYEQRTSHKPCEIILDYAVNCMGTQGDITKIKSPLFRQLLEEEYVTRDELGLGILSNSEGRIIGNHGKLPFYLLGPLRKATEWEATSVAEIRTQVERLSKQFEHATAMQSIKIPVGEVFSRTMFLTKS